MKRSPSDDLFKLIKSLNKGEKRNFKLLAGMLSGERDKKYLELFDLIDRQDVYNEPKLVRQLGDVYGGQISVGKHYLYKFILKSLVYYNSGPEFDLNNSKEQIRILISKDLYDQARKKLRKAIRQAEDYEDFNTLHQLHGFEMDILLRTQRVKDLAEHIQLISQKQKKALELLQNLESFHNLSNRMYYLMNTRHMARQPEDLRMFEEIANHPLVGSPSEAKSTSAYLLFLTILRKLASCTGDIEQAIYYSNLLIETYEDNSKLKSLHLLDYFREISNLGNYLFRSERYREAYEVQQRILQLMDEYPGSRHEIYPQYLVLSMAFSIALGRPDQAMPLVSQLEEDLPELGGKLRRSVAYMIYFLCASVYFMEGKHSDALRWVNLILNEPKSSVRIDLQCLARLLNLMIHYDLQNYMYVENELAATQRFLERNGFHLEFEQAALRGLKRMVLTAGTSTQKSVIEELQADIEKIFNQNQFEVSVDSFLYFSLWLKSIQTGMSLSLLQQAEAGIKWSDLQAAK